MYQMYSPDEKKSKSDREILTDIIKISGPQMVSFICGIGKMLINFTFIGHVGTE